MKPEAGQTLDDVFQEFLRWHLDEEAEYAGDADGVTLRLSHMSYEGYRRAMRMLRQYMEQPQPAEDPDEWVEITDPEHVLRSCDQMTATVNVRLDHSVGEWLGCCPAGGLGAVGHKVSDSRSMRFRCRRSDLPKVEQAEQWPKYYKSPNGIVERGTAETCVHTTSKGESGVCDWLKVYDQYVTDGDWKQITEAEAMALLKPKQCAVGCHGPRCPNPVLPGKDHCSECADEEPQPQKTRVRLWARPDGGHIWFCPDKPANGSWQEIHHDAEGFYVDGDELM